MDSLPTLKFQFGGYVIGVPTVASLRNLPVASSRSKGDFIFVSGALSAGDGSGGIYSWLPASLDNDDGQTTIRPVDVSNDQPGRWKWSVHSSSAELAALGTRITTLETSYNDPTYGLLALKAQIVDETTARAKGDQISIDTIHSIEATVTGSINDLSLSTDAKIAHVEQVIADSNSAQTTRSDAMTSEYRTNNTNTNAAITSNYNTLASADSAATTRMDSMSSEYRGQNTTTNARIDTTNTTVSNNYSALSNRIDSVQAGAVLSATNLSPDVDSWAFVNGAFLNTIDGNWGQSGRINNPPNGEQTYGQMEVPCSAGTTYTFSADFLCFASTSAAYTWIDFFYIDSNRNTLRYTPRASVNASSDFADTRPRSTYHVTDTAPDGAATIVLRWCGNGANVATVMGMRRPKLERGSSATSYSVEGAVTTAKAAVVTETTARVNAVSANATAIQNLTATVNGNTASINQQANVNSDLYGRTSARWSVGANSSAGRAQLSVYSDSNSGAGVDIVGNVSISGNLLVTGSVASTQIAVGAVTVSYPMASSSTFTGNGSGTNYDSSATPANGGGGGGGFGCVALDSFMPDGGRAADVVAGSPLTMLSEDGSGYFVGKATGNHTIVQPCYRMTTERGITLILSSTTPITTRNNEVVLVGNSGGIEIPTLIDGEFAWDRVARLDYVGEREVAFISADDGTYAAGEVEGRYIFSHNKVQQA